MIRVVYFLIWIVIFLIPVALVSLLRGTRGHRVYRWFYKIICRIFRLQVVVKGKVSSKEPVLFLANHVSYLDILVLGSVLPGSFISKAEVKKWPLFGWLAQLSGTIFLDRKRTAAGGHLKALEDALASGKSLILFPEGTTSDGKGVLPFKSSLFKIAEDREITVQPITVNYTHINGLPIQANERTKIAWVGDMDLKPHLKEFTSLGTVRAEVIIHEPIPNMGKDRKQLAEECHKIVEAAKK